MEELLKKTEELLKKKEFEKAKEILLASYEKFGQEFIINKNLGLCYVNLNNFEEARKYFEKTVELKSDDATSWYYLGVLYENSRMPDKAEKAYLTVNKLRETFPDAYKNLSIIYMKKKDLNKALMYAQKAKDLNPGDYQPYYIISSILVTQNRSQEIIDILQKGLELNPNHSNMHANIGGAYLELKQYDKALLHLNKSVELNPQNPIPYNSLTNLYLLMENFEKAYEMAKKLYEIDPSEIFLVSLAMCSMKAQKYDDAIKYYKSLSVLHPEKQHFQMNLANAYMGNNDYKSAQDILFRLYQVNPKSENTGLKLVECYKVNGNIPMAVMVLKKMISMGNISVDVRYEYAILSASMGDNDTAMEELKKIIKLQPKNALAHKDLAVIYLLRNQPDYAKSEFETAYAADKNSFSIVFEYANYLNQVQEFKKSKELYEKAIKLSNGEDADVYLFAAINLISLNEIESAYEYLIIADKKMPDNFETLSNLGKVMFFMGKFKESKEFCERALKINQNAETKNVLATSCMALGEFEDALQIFLELYEVNKNNINLMLSITKCYYELNDYDNALIIADKILAILPECSDAQQIVDKIQNKKDKK